MSSLLEIEGLNVGFRNAEGSLTPAVTDVTCAIDAGEFVGLVGESGSGKSVTGLALMNLLPPEIAVVGGGVRYRGVDLHSKSPKEWEAFRGKEIGMVFQEPMLALDPVFTIGQQVNAAARAHSDMTRKQAKERALEVLRLAEITDVEKRYDMYPHQLSGGMRQRVAIAMALISEPRFLIADEPTTALDVTTQAQLLETLARLNQETGTAVLLITHDFGVVAQVCRRVLTMYVGELIEDCTVGELLSHPLHPYSAGLLASRPGNATPKTQLPSIPGRVPAAGDLPRGCRFAARCSERLDECVETPQTLDKVGGRSVRCCRHAELELPAPAGFKIAR